MGNTREDLEKKLAALEQRVGELEDINAIRRLHWAYGYYIDFNRAEDVVQLFAKDGAVVFLSGHALSTQARCTSADARREPRRVSACAFAVRNVCLI